MDGSSNSWDKDASLGICIETSLDSCNSSGNGVDGCKDTIYGWCRCDADGGAIQNIDIYTE